MSNTMDVDAMAVAEPAEVTHWGEQEDEQGDLGRLFGGVVRAGDAALRLERVKVSSTAKDSAKYTSS